MKQWIKHFIFALVFSSVSGFLSFPPSALCAGRADTLTVLHLTDPHICNPAGYHPSLIQKRILKAAHIGPLEKFLQQTPREAGADLVVITGDMLDLYEAEIQDDLFQAGQIEQFAAMAQKSPVPLLMTLGNHDIRSYWIDDSSNGSRLFQLHDQAARAAWIRNIACFREGFSYRRIFKVGRTRYHFVFLDNSNDQRNGPFIDEPQLAWLNHELAQTGRDPVLIFMHKYHPALDYNGDGISFAAAAACALTDSTCSRGFLKACNENKNIKIFLAGHGHSRKSEKIPFPAGHTILQINPGAFVKDIRNWRLIKCTEQEILVFAPETNSLEWKIPID